MSDNIDIPVTAGSPDPIDRLTSAVDRLHSSIDSLANARTSAFEKQMAQMQKSTLTAMKTMQASMTTGFAELAKLAQAGGAAQVREASATGDKLLKEQLKWEAKQHAAANKFHYKKIGDEVAAENRRAAALQSLIEKRDMETYRARERDHASYVKFWERQIALQDKGVAAQRAIEQKRDTELHALHARQASQYVSWWEKQLAQRNSIEQRRDVELNTIRSKQHKEYVSWWDQQLRAQDAAHARQRSLEQNQQYLLAGIRGRAAAAAESEAERQRRLNTSFLTASPGSQLRTARAAQTYASMGGDAAARYGSSAATANIARLTQEHARLAGAVDRSGRSIAGHNQLMLEGHSLARGLSGSLGGLWLTYGSLVPLAAGAALTASLRSVVTAGKEVEYQLKFVQALSDGETVPLDRFLNITDGTLVSVQDAAEGMRALAQNGMNAIESLQALPTVLNLSIIGEMGVDEAALSITGAMEAFGKAKQDLPYIADIFAQAAVESNTSVKAITESMKQASTVSSLYGSTLEETSAALQVLAQINITGSAAGTAYTNMLTNLYSPTRQATAALKELGVTTDDGMGGLKNSTQLLTELRTALSGFSEPAKASFLGDIFTVRGQKAASAIIESMDDYKRRLEATGSAAGMTTEAIVKLEDSTTGAARHMANEWDGSLNRAFAQSSPHLQAMLMQLGGIAGSQATVSTLVSLADAVLRVTQVAIDNAAAIGTAVAAYAALRIVSIVAGSLSALTAAMAATTAATFTLTGGLRLLTSSLGAIGLAVTALTVLWQMFVSETTEVEKADQRLRNSIDTNIEMLKRETEALRERNAERNRKPGTVDEEAPVAKLVASLEGQIKAIDEKTFGHRTITEGIVQAIAASRQRAELEEQLKKAKFDAVVEEGLQNELRMGRMEEAAALEKATVEKSIAAMIERGQTYKLVNGEMINVDAQGNEKSRAIALSAQAIQDKLTKGEITAKQAKVELMAVEQKYNSVLAARPDSGGSDTLNVMLRKLELETQLARLKSDQVLDEALAANRRGEVGDLEMINIELAESIGLRQREIEIARLQMEAADAADKPGKAQAYRNKVAMSGPENEADRGAAVQRMSALMRELEREQAKFEAKTLASQGQYVHAYLADFEANYGPTMKALERDITLYANTQYGERLKAQKAYLEQMRTNGVFEAIGAEADLGLSKALYDINRELDALSQRSGEGAGLAGIFQQAVASSDLLEQGLAKAVNHYNVMREIAERPGATVADQKAADSAMALVDDYAERARQVWGSVGQAIERSLTTAFGKAGKAAGGMVNVMIGHAATEKRIHADLAKHQGKADYEERRIRAIKELDSVALTTYGNMAGAAKAYFEEGSSGYEALEKVERAFHAAQLAMVASEMVAKLFATETVTAAKTTAAATEGAAAVATVPVVMGAEAAKANAYGVTALAAALALPFPASLPAYATVAAMLAAIGVAVSGGGAGKESLSEQRQKKMGTGSVLGDANKASESISKALENIEKLTIDGLDYSAGMLDALRAIQGSIGGLANMVTRSLGLDGTDRVSNTVQNSSLPTKLLGIGAGAASGAAIGYGISLIGSVMGPIGMVLGGLIGGLLNKFSKVKTELLDQGIKLNSQSLGQASQGVTGVSYQDVKTKKSFLGITYSNNSDRASAPISDELKNQFTAVVANLREGILTAVTAIGEGGDAFVAKLDSLAVTIPEISLKGLTGEQIQEKLESVFSKLGDDLAIGATTQVPMKVWLQDFQKVGEGAFETLMRLATEYKAVDATLGMLGKSFGAVGQASLAARHQLVEMAGGIDELVSQTSFFAKNFLSKSEQIAPLQAELAKQVNPLNGGSAVTTMEQYKNLVMRYAGDTSEAGMKAYSVLLKLAPVFKTVADAAKEVAEESNGLRDQLDQYLLKPSEYEAKKRALERAQLDPANRDLFDQVQAAKLVAETREQLVEAYEREKSAMEENIERVRSLADSWKKFKTDLKLGDKSPLTPQEKYLEAKAQFHTTLARAQAGDTKAQDAFQSVAEKFLETSRVVNTSSPEYARDFNLVLSATDQAIVWAERQVDVGKASLDALKQQVSYLIDIEAATLSVTQAINALALLLGPQGGAAADANTRGVVEGLYQSLLGRSGDVAGVDFWTNALRSGGVSIADVVQAISRSVEFMNRTAPVNVPGAQPGPDQITPSALNRLYENMLGRAPDAAGAQFWMDAMRSGSTMDDVTRAIMGSAEYQQRNTAFQGAAANSGAFAAQGGSNALVDLVAQVRRMNDELAELRREQAQQVQDQIDAAFASTQAAADVMAQATAEAAESSAWANRSQAEFA